MQSLARTLLSGLACLTLTLAGLSDAAALDPELFEPNSIQQNLLERGEILTDVSQTTTINTEAVALVDAPIDEVWAVISDYGAQKHWVPDTLKEHHRVVKKQGKYLICSGGTDLPWPLSNRTYRLKMHNRKTKLDGESVYLSSWSYVEGSGNIEAMDGYWVLQSAGDKDQKTLVTQVTEVDLGMAVPSGMVKNGTQKRLPRILRALRERVADMNGN